MLAALFPIDSLQEYADAFRLPTSLEPRPDFSGTWVLDVKISSDDANGNPLNAETMTIQQTLDQLTVERHAPYGSATQIISRQGKLGRFHLPSGQVWVGIGRLVRNGQVLNVQGVCPANPIRETMASDWAITSDGAELWVVGLRVLETYRRPPDPPTIVRVKRIYRRQHPRAK